MGTSNLLTLMINSPFIGGEARIHAILLIMFSFCMTSGLDFISKLVNVMQLSRQHLKIFLSPKTNF